MVGLLVPELLPDRYHTGYTAGRLNQV